jgi:hypothetical protein
MHSISPVLLTLSLWQQSPSQFTWLPRPLHFSTSWFPSVDRGKRLVKTCRSPGSDDLSGGDFHICPLHVHTYTLSLTINHLLAQARSERITAKELRNGGALCWSCLTQQLPKHYPGLSVERAGKEPACLLARGNPTGNNEWGHRAGKPMLIGKCFAHLLSPSQ